jgi:hypothetical protein
VRNGYQPERRHQAIHLAALQGGRLNASTGNGELDPKLCPTFSIPTSQTVG